MSNPGSRLSTSDRSKISCQNVPEKKLNFYLKMGFGAFQDYFVRLCKNWSGQWGAAAPRPPLDPPLLSTTTWMQGYIGVDHGEGGQGDESSGISSGTVVCPPHFLLGIVSYTSVHVGLYTDDMSSVYKLVQVHAVQVPRVPRGAVVESSGRFETGLYSSSCRRHRVRFSSTAGEQQHRLD